MNKIKKLRGYSLNEHVTSSLSDSHLAVTG